MRDRAIEIKVGLLVLVSGALLVAFVFFLGKVQVDPTNSFFVDYRSAVGLKAGAPVKVAGVPAGKVVALKYRGDLPGEGMARPPLVRVEIALDISVAQTLHKDTRFYISTLGVLGEKYIEVDPGTVSAGSLPPGTIMRGEDPLRLEVVSADVNAVVGSVRALVEGNQGRIEKMIADADATLANTREMVESGKSGVESVLERANKVADESEALMRTINRVAGDGAEMEKAVQDAQATMANLRVITEDAKGHSAHLFRDASRTLNGLQAFVANMDALSVEGKEQILSSWAKVDEVVEISHAIAQDLKEGRGLVGALLQDPELYDDLKEMMDDLKRHPWKVLWKE